MIVLVCFPLPECCLAICTNTVEVTYLFSMQMMELTIALLFSIHLNPTMMMILLEMHVTTVSSLPTHNKRILIMMGLEESVMLMTMMEVLVSIMFLVVDTDNGSIVPKSSEYTPS